jgi:outer membrane lipoprotein carrier protein
MKYTRLLNSISLIVVAMGLAFFAAEPAYAQTVQDVVSLVENHYSGVKTMTAKVSQKNFLSAVSKTQRFDGTLWIKKPGKLRIDYSNGQVILVDGTTVIFYSKKSEQMIRKTFADVQEMNVPVAFLLGAAHIRDDFKVLQPDRKSPQSLELLPKKPGAAMKKLDLVVDKKGRVTNITIFDKFGNTSTIAFADVREGSTIKEGLFIFKAPKGTEVIEE